ncbi:MAG: retropepsin-like domain-containing protein, partial [Spirochaetales bacterium]|nr:retropepsin-like domain-containing protein [Spirochaetales bacterium]
MKPEWKAHVAQHCVLPISLVQGVSKREAYMQFVLALREMLGPTKRKPKEQSGDGKDEAMTIETEAAARNAWKAIGTHAKCRLAGRTVNRVILDPGSSHTLVDRACVDKLGLRIRTQRLPEIELANGQMEKVYELEGEVQAEVEGISAAIIARYMKSHGLYNILLGRDWLRKTSSRADFASDIYCLGGSVSVRQRRRQLEVLPPQNSDAELGANDDSSRGYGEEIAEEPDAMLAQFGLEKEEIFFEEDCTASQMVGVSEEQKKMIDDDANEWQEEIHFGFELQPDTVAEVRVFCLEYKDCFAKSFLD